MAIAPATSAFSSRPVTQCQDAYYGYRIGSGRTITFPQVRGRRARVLFDSAASAPVIYEFQVNNTPATPNPILAANKSLGVLHLGGRYAGALACIRR